MYWKVNPSAKVSKDENEALAKGLEALKFVSHTWDISRRPDKRFGVVDVNQVQTFIDVFAAEGGLDKKIDAKEVATSEFIDQANKFDLEKVRAQARSWKP